MPKTWANRLPVRAVCMGLTSYPSFAKAQPGIGAETPAKGPCEIYAAAGTD